MPGAIERLLIALEQELIEATDEEILAAASDLGMNPAMRGSAAFFGVTIDLRALVSAARHLRAHDRELP